MRNLKAQLGTRGRVDHVLRLTLIFAVFFVSCIGYGVAYDKQVSPGQWVNLSGPSAPSGVTYAYEWHITQGGSEVTVKNSTSSNVAKSNQNLKFWAPWYGSDTVLTVQLLVSAQKTGGSPLAGCSQTTTAQVLVQGPTDNDLTGDTGDYCTDGTSTYTYTKDGPGLTYQWYLGPVDTNPATQIMSGYYTGGITPASITSRTSSITIAWASLVPSLKDAGNVAVPPNSGTFTVTLKVTQDGTLQKTISKTVNLVPKPTPSISVVQ
ncbi:Uncharacterised protein [uncultured archaeon]|nr:Uncharacterised protein [uncultured archaeon]